MQDIDIKSFVKEIEDDYEAFYNKVSLKIIQARRNEKYFTVLGQNKIRASINGDLNKLQNTLNNKLHSFLTKAIESTFDRAAKELGKVDNALDPVKQVEKAFKSHQFYISHQINKSKNDIARFLRADLVEFNRYRKLNSVTRKDAAKEMNMLSTPKMTFMDRRGYNWDSKTYFSMLFHTAISQSRNQAFMDYMESNGRDLVKISSHNAKDACSKWEGKIISLSGATDGYPTYAQIRASKECFHPRCRHFLIAVDMEGRNETES